MLPFYDDNPVRRRPILTWTIIAACLVAYVAWQPDPFGPGERVEVDGVVMNQDSAFYLENALIPCELIEARPLTEVEGILGECDLDEAEARQALPQIEPDRQFFPDKNVWLSVLTSMFLHGSVLHIAGNLLFLWVFGNNVEDVFGRIGFALFYVAGGIVAALTHVAVDLGSTVPMVGASGAIAAVMGVYMVLFPPAKVRTAIFMFLIFVVNIRAFWVLGFWFVLQFFTGPDEAVAWAAHVGGFVFGVVVGLAVRMFRRPQLPTPTWAYPRYGGYGHRPC